MRVVLLGEYRAERSTAALKEHGADTVVLGSVDVRSCVEPDVVCGQLPLDLSDDALLALLRDHGADVVMPNVTSPGQERMLCAYARIAPRWNEAGGRMMAHPPPFARLATDKVAFHETASRRRWPVPRGMVCDEPEALMAAADGIGLPLIVKVARSESHTGRHFVTSRESLRRLAGTVAYPVLAQQVVTGEEVGVEILSLPGRTVMWPVASLWTLDSKCAPGKHVRVAPVRLPEPAWASLLAFIRDVTREFQPAGPWQMDLAVSAGELRLIELNGRLGGLSNLGWLSTGLDPHRAHVDAALGRPVPQPQVTHVAVELPVRNGSRLPPPPVGVELRSFVGTPTNPFPLLSGYYRALLKVPGDKPDPAREWLHGLDPAALLVSPDEAITQLARGVNAWEAPPGRQSPTRA